MHMVSRPTHRNWQTSGITPLLTLCLIGFGLSLPLKAAAEPVLLAQPETSEDRWQSNFCYPRPTLYPFLCMGQ
jgi:hypothetical protein